MDQAAGSAAKSRCDSKSSSPFSLALRAFSPAPTEMWIDGDPPGNSFITCAPPFSTTEKKDKTDFGLEKLNN